MAIEKKNEASGFVAWVDERFPFSSFIKNHLTQYYAPKILTFGIFLAH